MLGDLSAHYESNGNPACISDGVGDAGGVSYGAYQLSSTMGSVDRFIEWLGRHEDKAYRTVGDQLRLYPVTSEAFNDLWRRLGTERETDFLLMQHDFIQETYYDPACQCLAVLGFHREHHSHTMQDVIWSRAVQYGAFAIGDMFTEASKEAGAMELASVDTWRWDRPMIRAIYTVCQSSEWNYGPLRDSLHRRFENECNEALRRFEAEVPELCKGDADEDRIVNTVPSVSDVK